MAGLNNIREAYQSIYQSQLDERMDPEERALRRAEVADRKASRMDPKAAKKYADSEGKSAEREDKKSKGKHIHGMADSVELEGDLVEVLDKKFDSMRSRGGRSAPPEERSGGGEMNRKSKDYWADTLGKNRDRGKGSKAKRRAAEIGEEKDDSYLETDMNKRRKNNEKAIEDMKKTKGYADMVKAARKHFEETDLEEKRGLWDNIHAKRKRGERPAKPGEKGYPKTLNVEETEIVEGIKQARANVGASKCWKGKKLGSPSTKMKGGKEVPNCVPEEFELDERALDTAEKIEKERLVKGMKKSAADFKARYGERAKSVMYATATARAKKNMDTSKSDRRYAVEETSMEENADMENRKKGPRTPSQLAKREKLNKLINDIRSKKGEK